MARIEGMPDGPGATAPDEAVMRCAGVSQTYRAGERSVSALRSVTKGFPAGRITTVAGPSGSGKSTLLRILACLDRPAGGEVILEGRPVGDLAERGRRALRRYQIGYLFQNPADNLIDYLTAAEQVRLAADLRGVTVGPDDVDRLLDALGIGHRAHHRPVQLSGGEQQRLGIACAATGRPTVVLADEPTAELDRTASRRVLDAFRLLRATGTAFVLTSHDTLVIEASDHLLRLDYGETVESW